MIPILFYPGTHGNYIEFTLNKAIHGDKIHRVSPLGSLGTSHAQRDDENYLMHRSFGAVTIDQQPVINKDQPVIKIDFDSSEDIFVIQLNLKRSEDLNIDVDTLEHMTYQKLFGKYGPYGKEYHGPDKMIDDINKFTDLSPYLNIKDESWPAINSVDDFYNLPKHILDECINVFGFEPVQITESRPDAPRWVLRSLFKSWFYNQLSRPSSAMVDLDQYNYVYKLPIRKLYGVDTFRQEIVNIEKFFNIKMNLDNFSSQVHQQFIDMVPYKQSKSNCERIINSIDSLEHFQIKLNVLEEAYVNYCLEQRYGVLMPEEAKHYFKDTSELLDYVKNAL
jgi:hypothetical protein